MASATTMLFSTLLVVLVQAAPPPTPFRRPGQQMIAFFNSTLDVPKGFIRFSFANVNDGTDEMIVGVRLSNFVAAHGPFSYHIHFEPVPETIVNASEDCAKAKGHLSVPTIPDTFVCDQNHKELCQQGDLSGRFGKIKPDRIKTKTTVFRQIYSDEGLSLTSIKGRSIVIHDKDKMRIACANIMPVP